MPAAAGQPLPRLLFHSHRWQANLRVLEIVEVKTVPGVPMGRTPSQVAHGRRSEPIQVNTFAWTTVVAGWFSFPWLRELGIRHGQAGDLILRFFERRA